MKYKLLFFFFLPTFLSCKEKNIIRIRVDYNKEIKTNISDQYISSEHMFRLDSITFKGIAHDYLQLRKRDTNLNSITYYYANDDSLVVDNGLYIKIDDSIKLYEALSFRSERIDSFSNVEETLNFINKQDSVMFQRKDHFFSNSFKNDNYQGYVKEYFYIDSSKNRFTYTNSVYLELKKKSLKINHTIISTPNNKHLINSSRNFINSIEIDNN